MSKTCSSTTTMSTVHAARELARGIANCTACALHADRQNAVAGDGPPDARLVIVGSVPRRHEDLQGRALAGAARNVLDGALVAAGLDPEAVRVTCVVRCRPLDDRMPSADEIRACAAHLRDELELARPAVVVALGAFATAALLGRRVPLERVAGYRLDVMQGVTLVPTYHPNDAVHGDTQAAEALRRDLSVARAVLEGRMKSGAEALADMRSRLPAASEARR